MPSTTIHELDATTLASVHGGAEDRPNETTILSRMYPGAVQQPLRCWDTTFPGATTKYQQCVTETAALRGEFGNGTTAPAAWFAQQGRTSTSQ